MNNWLNKLERKYGRFGIPNLTNILVAGQILVFAIELFIDRTITAWVGLNRFFLLQGRSGGRSPLCSSPSPAAAPQRGAGHLLYLVRGHGAGKGVGRFPLYPLFLLGMVGTVLACLLTGVTASTYCLSLSLLLAFAMLYPEVQLLLFFVIPIRVKYFGFFAAALWVFSFLSAPLAGKLSYLLSMLNVWAFFGPMATAVCGPGSAASSGSARTGGNLLSLGTGLPMAGEA